MNPNRGSYVSNPNKGKWYKFNDTAVESFEMTDATIEAECFGGRYEVKVYDQCKYHCCIDVVSLDHWMCISSKPHVPVQLLS